MHVFNLQRNIRTWYNYLQQFIQKHFNVNQLIDKQRYKNKDYTIKQINATKYDIKKKYPRWYVFMYTADRLLNKII